jgi:Core-2/I-Branching enzyme
MCPTHVSWERRIKVKIAYLITAYNNPNHLRRLIRALSSSSSSFFIHIDRKSHLSNLSNIKGDNVHFSQERIPSYWGDFSTVEAILVLLRMALADQRRFDYFPLLSGTDYPLQPVSYIESFFERNRGKEFINIVRMPCKAAGKPISRLTTYKPSPGGSQIARAMRKLAVTIGVISVDRDYTSHLRNLVPYGGSTWWALSREACEYILSFVDNEPQIVKFFKHTQIPEESFFQTILGNSPYKARTQRCLTYADWRGGGSRPADITEAHLEFFAATASITQDDLFGKGEVLFARKFSDEAEEIVLQLDQLISEKERQLTRRYT